MKRFILAVTIFGFCGISWAGTITPTPSNTGTATATSTATLTPTITATPFPVNAYGPNSGGGIPIGPIGGQNSNGKITSAQFDNSGSLFVNTESNATIHHSHGIAYSGTPVEVIPAPSPGITTEIKNGQVFNLDLSSTTPTVFHIGNNATPTSGVVFGPAPYQSALALNIQGPYQQQTPGAGTTCYIESGPGPIQWFLNWIESDGK